MKNKEIILRRRSIKEPLQVTISPKAEKLAKDLEKNFKNNEYPTKFLNKYRIKSNQ